MSAAEVIPLTHCKKGNTIALTIDLDDRLGVRFENKKMMILGGTLDIEKVKNIPLKNVMEFDKYIEKSF
ncbi:MAG: hypothetical protein LBS04_00640 [Tannerellaceae bacterium]|jgi:NAD(P)H dehydrogenase (quinone)|nr:hypothetical protein [Tannerellaceae bacterium]